jgi:hypothetical protein
MYEANPPTMKQAMDTTIVTTVSDILLICFKYINKKHCIKTRLLQDKAFVQCVMLFSRKNKTENRFLIFP